MVKGCGRLAGRVWSMRKKSGTELSALFGSWIALPQDFDARGRRRLFFPLTGVLAVSLAGALCGSGLPGDVAQVSGPVGFGAEERVPSDGRIL